MYQPLRAGVVQEGVAVVLGPVHGGENLAGEHVALDDLLHIQEISSRVVNHPVERCAAEASLHDDGEARPSTTLDGGGYYTKRVEHEAHKPDGDAGHLGDGGTERQHALGEQLKWTPGPSAGSTQSWRSGLRKKWR